MARFTLQRITSGNWRLLDPRTDSEVGLLVHAEGSYRLTSDKFKMQAEAADPWLILRLVFNSEEFDVHHDGESLQLTELNARQLLAP
jgi:hypothetical protein